MIEPLIENSNPLINADQNDRPLYAQVVVNIDAPGLSQPFTYSIPKDVSVHVGDTVLVAFGASGQQIGHVVGVTNILPEGISADKIKPVICIIEGSNLFDQSLSSLAQWLAAYCLADLKDSIKLIAPAPNTAQIETFVALSPNWRSAIEFGLRVPGALSLLELLDQYQGKEAKYESIVKNSADSKALKALQRCGAVSLKKSVALPVAKEKRIKIASLAVAPDEAEIQIAKIERRSTKQAEILRALIELKRNSQKETDPNAEQSSSPARIRPLTAEADLPFDLAQCIPVTTENAPQAKVLQTKGLLEISECTVRRDPFSGVYGALSKPPVLNSEQTKAVNIIFDSLAQTAPKPILLYGVTGSGKTEVYMTAIDKALKMGRGALFILPEIALSAQVLDLLKARFGDRAAVLHSALSVGERYDEWRRIRSGDAPIVVGARSAIFAPVKNLGLIVMDEEHEPSYKQESSPRYHARDVALYRAKQSNALVVFGSATPSIESFHRALTGGYTLATLTKRISNRPLPAVRVVDMRKELTEKRDKAKQAARKLRAETASEALKGNLEMPVDPGYIPAPPPSPYFGVLSDELQTALGERIERGEQTILFLNRRGFSPFLLCRDCGFTFKCENCDVTLTYHRGSRILQCHHCNFQRLAPDSCPTCGSVRISPYGVGTEKVEDAVKDIFPAARTIRMDRDTTAHKGAHAFILRAFRAHEADVLIGTQMIAKGLDFPKVTLVGVINADTGLNAPDFRASEHSFQLLTQVSGRAGRGETPGEVIIQTFDPDNECIALASHHDYNNFFAQEIEHRRELKYPPFSRIATAIATGDTDSDAQSRSKRFADLINSQIPKLADNSRVQILGPAPCVVPRIKNRYRWRLMLRGSSRRSIALALRSALALLPPSDKMAITIDIDPANT